MADVKIILIGEDRSAGKALKGLEKDSNSAFNSINKGSKKSAAGMKALKYGAIGGAAAFAATAVVMKEAINKAKGFESALTDMGKVSEENLGEIREKIMGLPADLGSATELVKGYYQTISAGVTDPKRAMETLTVAARASKAAHVDQASTIKALTKLMAGFGGEIESVGEASDLLFAIEKKGQTSFAELVPIIGDIASISKQAGVNQYEMGAAMAQITQTAGSTGQAATQYRAIVMGLLKPQKNMTEALKQMGFESGQAAIEQLGFAETLRQVEQYASGSGLSLGQLFESSEALTGIGPLLQSQFKGYNEALAEMEGSAGGTDKAFRDWKTTFEATEEIFDNTIGKVMIDLGTELMPDVQQAMLDFSGWVTDNRGDLLQFFGALGDAIKAVAEFAGNLVNEISTTRQWYQAWDNDQISTSEWMFTGNDAAAERLTQLNGGPQQSRLFDNMTTSYAVGTQFVPSTGLYQLHQGEKVTSRNQAAKGNEGMNMNPQFNFTIHESSSPEQTARAVARLVMPELRNMAVRFNS